MKILLIQPPICDFYRTEFREYPLGLLYLAASLENKGFAVSILDARYAKKPKIESLPTELEYLKNYYTKENNLFLGYKYFGLSYDEIKRRVKEESPSIVVINAMFTPYINEVFKTAKTVKEVSSDIKVIVGGYHATVDPDSLSSCASINAVVMGEGELILPEIIKNGIDKKVYLSESCKPYLVENLDNIGFPARHLIDSDHYKYNKKRYTMILTSRGCPHNCSFCSVHAVVGFKHRTRNVDNVMAEINECVDRYKIECFDFQDDNLLFDRIRIKKLLEKIIDKYGASLELLASNGLNAAHLDDELLELMRRAGFKKLDIALGTGGVAYREKLNRPETLKKYESGLDKAARLDLKVTTYIILGIPTQSINEMKETVDYLKTRETLISPSIFYNVRGMPIYDEMYKYEYSHDNIARRSSAMNNCGIDFTRDDIFKLFREIREYNLCLYK